MKFAVGFVVPYPTRIGQIASSYRHGGRTISIYDTLTLVSIVALIVLLFLTEMQEQGPEISAPPRKIMSYAIQANPGLAWREIILMTALFCWALYALIGRLIP